MSGGAMESKLCGGNGTAILASSLLPMQIQPEAAG
jgi:hypothetical protein